MKNETSPEEVNALSIKLKKEAEDAGYNLNPDEDSTKDLIRSLIINEKRYGYRACPCRLASGKKQEDLDIICPCDYRDQDLNDYGSCYCALYVSEDIAGGLKKAASIPERRLPAEEMAKTRETTANSLMDSSPIWRCKVCGYLCARNQAPEICPICKAKKDRFEKFFIERKTPPELPVWYCRVCGYLCARNEPPELCPVCKAKKERFDRLR